ncbi:MAG TPA: recombinase family protein [Acidimicrobiales bacterium]
MRAALYARVSTESQEQKGTIGSQLEVLRARIAAEGHELVAEYCDDGISGARLDRPGLDRLRDEAEAGVFEVVWCASPDRLARAYPYQVLILDELARLGVQVCFVDAPMLDDDSQLKLLTQVQGVIAEWERAKIAERNRRGKLYRSRAGEIISWKAPYGYRRVPKGPQGPAYLEVFEPEAAVVRRIFDEYVTGGRSIRQITVGLAEDGVVSPSGVALWHTATLGRLLRNEAYVGRVYYNRTQATAAVSKTGRRVSRQRPRPKEEWIPISVPAMVSDEVFEAAQRAAKNNTSFSRRNLKIQAWLLRGLVVCGACGVRASTGRARGRAEGSERRYYYCSNRDPFRVGSVERRCPERHIRADVLDEFVFDQIRQALLHPATLLAGEAAVSSTKPAPDDQLLAAELGRLQRKRDNTTAERRRLADLYQTGLLELSEVHRRAGELDARFGVLTEQRDRLISQRHELTQHNRLRNKVSDFARRVNTAIDSLDFDGRQQLMRLVVEQVRVTGWQVEIHLRIPLDGNPDTDNDGGHDTGPSTSPRKPKGSGPTPNRRDTPRRQTPKRPSPGSQKPRMTAVSSKDRLRSLRQ